MIVRDGKCYAENPLPVCLSAIPAVFSLVIVLLSRGMAKRAER